MSVRPTNCVHCAAPVTQKPKGRHRHYCSRSCNQAAYIARIVTRERAAAVAAFATAIQDAVVGVPLKVA